MESTSQLQHKEKHGLSCDVIVAESPSFLKLLSIKDQALLVRRNVLFVLNLPLHILNSIVALYLNRNDLAKKSMDKDMEFLS